jgi:hypothetical protein
MRGREYCRELADRLHTLIAKADDRLSAMDELAGAAERGGLIDCDNMPRRESPWAFVADLLLDNPLAGDWMNARLRTTPRPASLKEISQIAERLE